MEFLILSLAQSTTSFIALQQIIFSLDLLCSFSLGSLLLFLDHFCLPISKLHLLHWLFILFWYNGRVLAPFGGLLARFRIFLNYADCWFCPALVIITAMIIKEKQLKPRSPIAVVGFTNLCVFLKNTEIFGSIAQSQLKCAWLPCCIWFFWKNFQFIFIFVCCFESAMSCIDGRFTSCNVRWIEYIVPHF